MTEKDDWIDRFIAHLEALRDREERGALAALRRGAGSPPGTVAAMYPHILPWVPRQRRVEDAAYVIGSLFALHPQPGGTGTLGKALSMIPGQTESLEKRFVALLNSHYDDLPHHLRQAVSLLKSSEKQIPVDWRQLLRDMLYWEHEKRFVQQRWAREFWREKEKGASEPDTEFAKIKYHKEEINNENRTASNSELCTIVSQSG
jgi:CRISPR system Cascade subunit CasB